MTRAMEELTLTSAAERMRFGSRTYGVPSRFLREIPEEVIESVTPRRPSVTASRSAASAGESSYDYSYAQEAPDDASDVVQPGLRVRHARFGAGVVLSTEGSGPSQKLTVKFDRAGVKKLVLKYANLELG